MWAAGFDRANMVKKLCKYGATIDLQVVYTLYYKSLEQKQTRNDQYSRIKKVTLHFIWQSQKIM